MQGNNQPNDKYLKDEISLREIILKVNDWFLFLLTKRKLILLTTLLGGIIGILYAYFHEPSYTAEVSFVLQNNGNQKGGGYSSIAAQFGINLPGSTGGVFQGDDNLMAFVVSRKMVVNTLLSPDVYTEGKKLLIDRYVDFNGFRDDWKNNKKYAHVKFYADETKNGLLEDSLLNIFYSKILKNNLSVGKPDKKNDVIVITTVAPDQYFSKEFSEKLLENVTQFYIQTETKRSLENVNILRFQADSIRSLLNNALSGVAVSSDANPNMNPAFQVLKVPSQKRMVDVEMNKAILEEIVKQLEMSEITMRKETPLVQVIDTPHLPIKPQKVGFLKGTVIGMFLGGFLTVLFLSLRQFFKKIMQKPEEVFA